MDAFVAGVFSGITKCVIGHPFDTIKVRLQTSDRFTGPIDAVKKTFRNEGIRGFMKGITPPLCGWMFMDSLMLGSMHRYRALLSQVSLMNDKHGNLNLAGHSFSGMFAGWTVSVVATPIEHVKSRLQIQYNSKSRIYTGPVHCAKELLRQGKLYKGFLGTMAFRSWFFVYWGSIYLTKRVFERWGGLWNGPVGTFLSGGIAAQVFWIGCYPADIMKQRMMTDKLFGGKYPHYIDIMHALNKERAWFRGFWVCFWRSFPVNAAALLVFETVQKGLAPIKKLEIAS